MKSSEDPSLQDREVRTPPSPLPARQRGPAGLEPHREGEDTVLLSVGYHLFNSGDTSSISLTLVPCGSWYQPILLTGHHISKIQVSPTSTSLQLDTAYTTTEDTCTIWIPIPVRYQCHLNACYSLYQLFYCRDTGTPALYVPVQQF